MADLPLEYFKTDDIAPYKQVCFVEKFPCPVVVLPQVEYIAAAPDGGPRFRSVFPENAIAMMAGCMAGKIPGALPASASMAFAVSKSSLMRQGKVVRLRGLIFCGVGCAVGGITLIHRGPGS